VKYLPIAEAAPQLSVGIAYPVALQNEVARNLIEFSQAYFRKSEA